MEQNSGAGGKGTDRQSATEKSGQENKVQTVFMAEIHPRWEASTLGATVPLPVMSPQEHPSQRVQGLADLQRTPLAELKTTN